MFEEITGFLSSTEFFKEHMAKWAPPLNDPSFDVTFLFFVLMILFVPEILDLVRTVLRRRIKAKKDQQRELPERSSEAVIVSEAKEDLRRECFVAEPGSRSSMSEQVMPLSEPVAEENPVIEDTELQKEVHETESNEADLPEVLLAENDEMEELLALKEEPSGQADQEEEADDYTIAIRDIRVMQENHRRDEEEKRRKEEAYREKAELSEKELLEMFSGEML